MHWCISLSANKMAFTAGFESALKLKPHSHTAMTHVTWHVSLRSHKRPARQNDSRRRAADNSVWGKLGEIFKDCMMNVCLICFVLQSLNPWLKATSHIRCHNAAVHHIMIIIITTNTNKTPGTNKGVRSPWAKRLIRLNIFKSLQVFPKDLSYLVSIYSKTFSNWAVIKSEVLLSATKLQLSVSCLMARFLSNLSTAVLVRTVITSHIH